MANSSFLIFGKFMGTGLVVTWFLAGLVYLFLSEKNKTRRLRFIDRARTRLTSSHAYLPRMPSSA